MERKYYCPHCKAVLDEAETEEATASINPYRPEETVKLPYRKCKKCGCAVIPVPAEQ